MQLCVLLSGAAAFRPGMRIWTPVRYARASKLLALHGGGTMTAVMDDETLRRDYERYKAAVEMPLSNIYEKGAQLTQAIRLRGLLSREDIEAVHTAGRAFALKRPDATIDRSAWGQPNGTWLVTFLNTDGAFETMLPELYSRIRDAALAVDREHWNVASGAAPVNYRVVEYHTMYSSLDGQPTRGGLRTVRHCDQGSLVTVDVLLTDRADFEGGVLQTLEADGELLSHDWEAGDALVFLSHKYHSVSELTHGTRQVMVCELWQGTENQTPTHDEQERWLGCWKNDKA